MCQMVSMLDPSLLNSCVILFLLCLDVALVFIDKYTQIPRMLSPVAHCIDSLLALNSTVSHGKARSGADMVNEQLLSSYVKAEWGSVDSLTLQILSSFFKNAFDGSGWLFLLVETVQ